ncbi:hypothetical protein N9V31_03610 [Candidatus Poseidonia alphae]|nr:hypothetical protein [Candidatus Poseidonia alphae]
MSVAEDYVEKLVKSVNRWESKSDVADLVEILYSNNYVFFKEVMKVFQTKRQVLAETNCSIEEVTEKVWLILLHEAKTAMQQGDDEVAYRIMKVILDGSETHPWPMFDLDGFLIRSSIN